MSLKTKFTLLVTGIIVVPFLVSLAALSFHVVKTAKGEPVLNYYNIVAWTQNEVIPRLSKGEQHSIIDSRPEGLELVILDGENRVVLSSIERFQEGSYPEYTDIISYMKQTGRDFETHLQAIHTKTTDYVLLSQYVNNSTEKTFRIHRLEMVAYVSTTLGIAAFIVAFFLARSITSSIKKLEQATRRIAEGDLDFKLEADGKDEFASLTRSFDRMREKLKEQIAQRARFIMGVSHDLKTPLALIEGYVEAIADGYAENPELLRKYTDIIQEKVKTLTALITDLMNVAKMETGEWKMTLKDVHLKSFLEGTGKRFSEDASLLKREFSFHIDIPEDITVPMDERLMNRVMENIIGNGFRYTEEGGKVSLEAFMKGEQVIIAIRDTGIGISEEDLRMIFTPFHRATNSRHKHGTGLGLYIAKSILDSHGFKIWIESEEGKGTTIYISI